MKAKESYPRILVVAVYFGTLPDYLPLWLKSCSYNRDIDWLLITDDTTHEMTVPANVHVRRFSMEELRALVSEFAETPISLSTPYKVCDLRPLYSCLTALVPGVWDFWGHCDLDMIFGDIRRFLTNDLLLSNDRIFGVGHFSLYRNDVQTNSYFRRPHPQLDYREILADPNHRAFDEHIGVNRIWRRHGGRFHEDETVLADIDPAISQMVRISSYERVENNRLQVFCFDRGSVMRLFWSRGRVEKQDFMYIHFQKRRIPFSGTEVSQDRFYITPRGFIPMTELGQPDRATLAHLNPVSAVPSLSEINHRLRKRLRVALRRPTMGRV